jgi:hypothetical protein
LEEAKASMVAVSASAHALDALFGSISQIISPARTDTRWSSILETVKRAGHVTGSAGGAGGPRAGAEARCAVVVSGRT